ncbi:hypothetical protein K0M31_006892 [Melipona bicolor]|uniref:Uncharacterized protein n=1 Tax=Melipona bicolor TaxID=60889 RepID=A0AA40KL92_9HYME|nr:hypothetical protein K0M31_006892 [Melipona bicolor]
MRLKLHSKRKACVTEDQLDHGSSRLPAKHFVQHPTRVPLAKIPAVLSGVLPDWKSVFGEGCKTPSEFPHGEFLGLLKTRRNENHGSLGKREKSWVDHKFISVFIYGGKLVKISGKVGLWRFPPEHSIV